MAGADDTCFVCDGDARSDDPRIPEEYYPGLWCHLSCLNSLPGTAWRAKRSQSDPGYARYLRFSTVGLPVICPSCGGHCRLSAKARGLGAGIWETCCLECSRTTFLNGSAHGAEYQRLGAAERSYLLHPNSDAWRTDALALARTADKKLRERTCVCGGRFSLAAKPRCPHCRAVLLDSFFHYASAASPMTGSLSGEGNKPE